MENTNRYACHGFHNDLPKGKSSGTFSIDGNGIHYEIGHLKGWLTYNQLTLKLGGASNRLVFLEHPSLSELSIYTSDLNVLKDTHLRAHPNCAPQLLSARQQRAWAWSWVIGVFALVLLTPVFIIWRMDWVSNLVVKQIPVSWEQKLGETVEDQYHLTKKEMSRKETDEKLQPVVKPLLDALHNSPYKYKFTIVNEGSVNAFALPGGYVTIHSALILRAESAEELLGVVGHEINHVEKRHGFRSIVSNSGIYLIASVFLGDVSGLLAAISSAAPMLMSQSYSRRFETEADEEAVALLKAAHINPQGLPSFFAKMIDDEKKAMEKVENETAREALKTAMSFLSTHPASDKRMENLNKLIGDHTDNYRDLSTEFSALKESVKVFVESNETADEKENSSGSQTHAESSAASSVQDNH